MATALLIFSDLDGTLLEHGSYSFDAARGALARAKSAGVPIILATSKTAAEVRDLARDMELDTPAIVENGGGIWFPNEADEELHAAVPPSNLSYNEILHRLGDVQGTWQNRFIGFNTMSVEDVMRETGLKMQDAEKAKMREHSVPGLWTGQEEDLAVFLQAVHDCGLQVLQGGRFIHIMGQTNKAQQLQRLKSAYEELWPSKVIRTAALGDAPNDKEMIEAADFGIIVTNPEGKPIPELPGELNGKIVRTHKAGPAGWNVAVNDILDRLGIGLEQGETRG